MHLNAWGWRRTNAARSDSRNGLLAAKGAGLDVAIVASEFFGDEQFEEAQLLVAELTELLTHV